MKFGKEMAVSVNCHCLCGGKCDQQWTSMQSPSSLSLNQWFYENFLKAAELTVVGKGFYVAKCNVG